MTYKEFYNSLIINIKRDYGYESKARLLDFIYTPNGNVNALCYNEETKKFLVLPIQDVRFVHKTKQKTEASEDNNIKKFTSLFGDDCSVTMESFHNNFKLIPKDKQLFIESKEVWDKSHGHVSIPLGDFTEKEREIIENKYNGGTSGNQTMNPFDKELCNETVKQETEKQVQNTEKEEIKDGQQEQVELSDEAKENNRWVKHMLSYGKIE